jgi:hypothetical protein
MALVQCGGGFLPNDIVHKIDNSLLLLGSTHDALVYMYLQSLGVDGDYQTLLP